jgi:hypothetical protein
MGIDNMQRRLPPCARAHERRLLRHVHRTPSLLPRWSFGNHKCTLPWMLADSTPLFSGSLQSAHLSETRRVWSPAPRPAIREGLHCLAATRAFTMSKH